MSLTKNGPLVGSSLHVSSQNGKDKVVSYLISKGANVNSKNNREGSPLHLAAQHGFLDIVFADDLNLYRSFPSDISDEDAMQALEEKRIHVHR